MEKCFYLGENPVVVTLSLYDDVTTTQFLVKIMYFKALKTLELALEILLNIWQTILEVNFPWLYCGYMKAMRRGGEGRGEGKSVIHLLAFSIRCRYCRDVSGSSIDFY